jgi:ketosteroid isomerase-like protein
MVLAAFMVMSQPALADDLADLKATQMRMVKAVQAGDVETMFGIFHDGRIRFGANSAFPSVMRDRERTKQAYAKFFETHRFRIIWYKPDYRVVGNTGLVWGLNEINVMSKNGPTQRLFLKTSLVYVKSEGKWKLILNHYTPIPPTRTLY